MPNFTIATAHSTEWGISIERMREAKKNATFSASVKTNKTFKLTK